MPGSDIDAVIARLGDVVVWARAERSRAGYFAALYRKVTVAVQAAIDAGEFEDAARMARLDVVFAERYLDAFDAWRAGGRPTAAWQSAFDAVGRRRPLIVQQLVVGINAHINLDLGVAAATVAPGADLESLRRDFDTINRVLARLVAGVMDDIASVSPWIGFLDRIGGRKDQAIVGFSIDVARAEAWRLATQLAPLPAEQWTTAIGARDRWTAGFARFLLRPGWLLPLGLAVIRLRESNDVERVMDVLGD